ncbi:MAG: nitroreductase family protein [Bacteroidales bacterium]|nr:nitroreductase family protein [Bacteroidales bacterium]
MDKLHKLITDRWSPVAFDDRAVDYDQIHLLFEAAKWAPSAMNGQPWRFIFATKEMSDFAVFLDLMSEANRRWAATAPLLAMPLAQVISTHKNRPNRLAFYETGMAVGNLLMQATALGLMVHQMSGYDVARAKETLVIPTRYEPMTIMAIGYKGDPSKLPEEVAAWETRERTRMEISKFLVQGRCK